MDGPGVELFGSSIETVTVDEVSNMHHIHIYIYISTSLVIKPCMKEHPLNVFSEEEMPEQQLALGDSSL